MEERDTKGRREMKERKEGGIHAGNSDERENIINYEKLRTWRNGKEQRKRKEQ